MKKAIQAYFFWIVKEYNSDLTFDFNTITY